MREIKKTIGLSQESWELICENDIKNLSEFVDELLLDVLQDKKFWIRRMNKALERVEYCKKKAGLKTDLTI